MSFVVLTALKNDIWTLLKKNMRQLLWIHRPHCEHTSKPVQLKMSWIPLKLSEVIYHSYTGWTAPLIQREITRPTIYPLPQLTQTSVVKCVYVCRSHVSKCGAYNPVNACPKFHGLKKSASRLWVPFHVSAGGWSWNTLFPLSKANRLFLLIHTTWSGLSERASAEERQGKRRERERGWHCVFASFQTLWHFCCQAKSSAPLVVIQRASAQRRKDDKRE